MSCSSRCWRQSTVKFSPAPAIIWPGRRPSTSKSVESWGLTGIQRRPLVTTAEGADPWHFRPAQRPPQKIVKRFNWWKKKNEWFPIMVFVSLWGYGHLFRWGPWSCVLQRYMLSMVSLVLPDCVDILKVCLSPKCSLLLRYTQNQGVHFLIRNNVERREMSKGRKSPSETQEWGGKNLLKNMLTHLLTALGSTSERAEEFSSALTWVRNACQQHVWAQRTRHTVQTIFEHQRAPGLQGELGRGKGKQGSSEPLCWWYKDQTGPNET